MRGGTVEFWIAVVALCVAVWAVVRAERAHQRAVEADCTATFGPGGGSEVQIDARLQDLEIRLGAWSLDHDARLRALEERLENVERYGEKWWRDAMPPLLRAGGSKPEIRNVEGED